MNGAVFHPEDFSIGRFMKLRRKNQLVLKPKFQRRKVWKQAARSYLIDTVVRGYPMPKVYLRRTTNPKTRLDTYEVVDGQQRLRACLDFYDGELVLSKIHNEEFGNCRYKNLPEPVQRRFLEYKISSEVMERATDPEVWAMFERLNQYTLTLNPQERRNSKHFGHFKQAAYMLAAEQSALDAWAELRIFTDYQIARMKEVEFTSDVLVAMIYGVSDITYIGKAYENLDKKFPRKTKTSNMFRKCLSYLVENLGGTVRSTGFRKKTWFYSLMVAVADALAGIPEGHGPAKLQPSNMIAERMLELDEGLKSILPPAEFVDVHNALSRGTSHVRERKIRHKRFFSMLTMPGSSWKK